MRLIVEPLPLASGSHYHIRWRLDLSESERTLISTYGITEPITVWLSGHGLDVAAQGGVLLDEEFDAYGVRHMAGVLHQACFEWITALVEKELNVPFQPDAPFIFDYSIEHLRHSVAQANNPALRSQRLGYKTHEEQHDDNPA